MIRLLGQSIAGLVMGLAATAAVAQHSFVILDDCSLMSRLHNVVASNESGLTCRPPRDDLERALSPAYVAVRTCLLGDSDGLPGDLCFRMDGGKARTLACIEYEDADEAAQIQDDYSVLGSRIATYLANANHCHGSNGDAASVSIQLPPGPGLDQVAKLHDVAFAEKFDGGDAVLDFVEEGYATIDPALRRPGRRYLHFVLIGWNWDDPRTPGSVVSLGGSGQATSRAWKVEVETSDVDQGARDLFSRFAAASPFPMVGFAVTLDVNRSAGADPGPESRRALIDKWSGDLVKLYSDHGFDIVSDVDLRKLTGTSMAGLREKMLSSSPYLNREEVRATLGPTTLLTRSEPSCQAADGTQRFAYILSNYGRSDDPGDYGSLHLIALVVSTCASDAQRVGTSQRRAANAAAAIVKRIIEESR